MQKIKNKRRKGKFGVLGFGCFFWLSIILIMVIATFVMDIS